MKSKSRLVFTKEQLEQSACATLNKAAIDSIDNPVKRYHLFIGVDIGTHTGFAVWKPDIKTFIILETWPIHIAMLKVQSIIIDWGAEKILIRVEDARQATYGRSGEKNKAKEQGAGSIKRDSTIWNDYLKYLGAHYEMVRPSKAHTKWDADKFNKITGYTGRTSQHARDAATMVFGLQTNYIQTKK